MEDIIGAGFPSIVQRLLKLSLEEVNSIVVAVMWHKGLAEILHVLET